MPFQMTSEMESVFRADNFERRDVLWSWLRPSLDSSGFHDVVFRQGSVRPEICDVKLSSERCRLVDRLRFVPGQTPSSCSLAAFCGPIAADLLLLRS